jgi:hypothetical protein
MNRYLVIPFVLILSAGLYGGIKMVFAQDQSDDICYALHLIESANPENVWDSVPEISSDFHYPWRPQLPELTRFQAFTDGTRLHFRFMVEDTSLISPGSVEDEKAVDASDRVEIFFAPGACQGPMTKSAIASYYVLEVAPNSLTHDYQAAYYRKFNSEWDAEGLETNTAITTQGYDVSGSLPLVPIVVENTPVKIGQKIWASVFRADFRMNDSTLEAHWISWIDPATNDPDFHMETAFGCWKVTRP